MLADILINICNYYFFNAVKMNLLLNSFIIGYLFILLQKNALFVVCVFNRSDSFLDLWNRGYCNETNTKI